MPSRIAITRQVSPAITQCQLTFLERRPIDLELARRQHGLYERCLAELGCRIHQLPEDQGLPDSVFVEDTCMVLDELAVLTRPGAKSRRGELPAIAEALGMYRLLRRLEEPARLDGGDV